MYRLRSTAKLLARMKVAPEREHESVETTTRLGDWYANLVHVGRTSLVLAVSDRTLLPVVFRARELSQIVPRLAQGGGEVLGAIGAPDDAIDRELAAIKDTAICQTASRRVLGSMTDFAFMMGAYTKRELNTDDALIDLSVWLAGTPCSPIAMVFPCDAAIAALGGADLPAVV